MNNANLSILMCSVYPISTLKIRTVPSRTATQYQLFVSKESSLHTSQNVYSITGSRCSISTLHTSPKFYITQRKNAVKISQGFLLARHKKTLTPNCNLSALGIWGSMTQRFNSTESTATNAAVEAIENSGYIPPPPNLPEFDPSQAQEILNALGEPTLSSLGLCNYTPVGLAQMGLESLHVSLDIPWFGAIALGTLALRIILFPLVIKTRKTMINSTNHMPTVTRLQQRYDKLKRNGNMMEASEAALELQSYMKRNNVKVFQAMLMPLVQAPVFISMFIGLRKMAQLPVESMQTGGLWWFTDLTTADPYFILPIISMSTLLLTIELGADSPQAASMPQTMRYCLRAMPFVLFLFVMHFPNAVLCYWVTNNSFSLLQMLFLKIEPVKKYLNIPDPIKHPDMQKRLKKKGSFIDGFREAMEDSKLVAEMEQRRKAEHVLFKEAGNKPVVKTYTYDPTKKRKLPLKAKS